MKTYQIVFSPTAAKQLSKLTTHIAVRLANAIAKLAQDPKLGKQLKGELDDYRSYRVGEYRIVYFIRAQKVQVEIIRIGHRRDVYR